MSANPITNDAVDISTAPTASPGQTIGGDSVFGVSVNSYNAPIARSLNTSSKARISGLTNAATFTDQSLAVFGNTKQGVILKGKAGATWGLNKSGTAIQIGGAVVDASKAKRVVVTLSDNKVNNASGATAPSRLIPSSVPDSIKTGSLNTISKLSNGADQYTGTTAKDLVAMGRGKDQANMGKGDDLAVMNSSLNVKRVTLGQGSDRVVLNKTSLREKGRLVIDDFSRKNDQLILQTKESRVKGIGSDTLRISTKNGAVRIISEGSNFSRSSVDFIS